MAKIDFLNQKLKMGIYVIIYNHGDKCFILPLGIDDNCENPLEMLTLAALNDDTIKSNIDLWFRLEHRYHPTSIQLYNFVIDCLHRSVGRPFGLRYEELVPLGGFWANSRVSNSAW